MARIKVLVRRFFATGGILAVWLVFIALSHGLLLAEPLEDLERARAEEVQRRQHLEAMQRRVADLAQTRRHYEAVVAEYESASRRLPRSWNLNLLIDAVAAAARKFELEMLKLDFSDEKVLEFYATRRLRTEVAGSYETIVRFVHALAVGDGPMIVLGDFELKRGASGHAVTGQLSFEVFRYVDEGELARR